MTVGDEFDAAVDGLAGAEYVVDADGQLALTDQGDRLEALRRRVDELGRALDRSYVGACWAGLFATHGWLDRLAVRISASHEYDDEGGTYRSFSSTVDDVLFRPGTLVPQDLLCDGQPDAELAAELLEDDLNELAADTFLCLEQRQPVEDQLALDVSRERLAGLWRDAPVSGKAAFAALFEEACDGPADAEPGTGAA